MSTKLDVDAELLAVRAQQDRIEAKLDQLLDTSGRRSATDRDLDRNGVCRLLGISNSTLHTMVGRGELPAPDYHIGRSPRWRRRTIDRVRRKGR